MSSSSGDGSSIDDVDPGSDSDTLLSAMERLKALTRAPSQDPAAATSLHISEKQKNDFISRLVSSASCSGRRNTKGTSVSTSSKAKGKRKRVASTSISQLSSTASIPMSTAHDETKRNLKRVIVSNTVRKTSGRLPKDPVCGLISFHIVATDTAIVQGFFGWHSCSAAKWCS